MAPRTRAAPCLILLALLCGGCVCCAPEPVRAGSGTRAAAPAAPTAPDAPAGPTEALYRGSDGGRIDLAAFLREARAADLVAIGELHGHPAGARLEREVLEGLLADERPLALALEFFERDVQPVLDRYLRGEIPEEEFLGGARQGRDYARMHRPLVEACKERGVPVIAANAPRRLVTAWRKSDAEWEAYRAGLGEEERGWLPRETSVVDDAYKARFDALMGPERAPTFCRAQSLWDDAMAESIADFRAAHPRHRVLFVVGAFHVARGEGTLTKYRLRRGKDEVRVLVMEAAGERGLAFEPDDAGLGDAVFKVRMPERAPKP
jgi:uncharacterized iron-regulated protein